MGTKKGRDRATNSTAAQVFIVPDGGPDDDETTTLIIVQKTPDFAKLGLTTNVR
jgi:hypothetical protein